MTELLNIAVYVFLTYAGLKLLKMIGIDILAAFGPKIDHNIYIINNAKEEQADLAPATTADAQEPALRYKMNYNDKYLKNILKNKPKKKKEYIDNIFDLI